jgi:monoamine oxidase
VVGGGLAGLAAARLLADSFCPRDDHGVLLLEAAPSLGGRVQHVSGLAPWPVEELGLMASRASVMFLSYYNAYVPHVICM